MARNNSLRFTINFRGVTWRQLADVGHIGYPVYFFFYYLNLLFTDTFFVSFDFSACILISLFPVLAAELLVGDVFQELRKTYVSNRKESVISIFT